MSFPLRRGALLAAALTLAGCASLPREHDLVATRSLVAAQRDIELPAFDADAPIEVPTAPISVDAAVQLAFFNNPRIREQYARLGLARAELEEARRVGNPEFGWLRLSPRGGGGNQITRSLSLGFTDLLLLPARKRFAEADRERVREAVAASLLELAAEVESSWYEAVAASQIADMRDLVARAATGSAELAQRYFDAGNLSRLEQAEEEAAAARARIDAVRARAEAMRARVRLAALIGLPAALDWQTERMLPAPLDTSLDSADVIALARENRLDLSAAQRAVAMHEDALGLVRRWRWLGDIEIGFERETEPDGAVMRGPSLALEIPLFDQGQGALARAEAKLLQARAEYDALLLQVGNDAGLGIDALAAMRDIVERYRTEFVPRQETLVAERQKQVNFMLVGVFELLRARQAEYDAYQEYLEAVRDYWIARAELRRAVGGRLPDDDAPREPSIGVEAILPDADAQEAHPSGHDAHAHHARGEAHPAPQPEAAAAPGAEATPAPHANDHDPSDAHHAHDGHGDMP